MSPQHTLVLDLGELPVAVEYDNNKGTGGLLEVAQLFRTAMSGGFGINFSGRTEASINGLLHVSLIIYLFVMVGWHCTQDFVS